MEAPQRFRTAWNGFHRDDVVQYLEYLNAKHQSQVNQLNMELEALRSQVKTLEDAEPAPDPELLSQCETLRSQLAEAEARNEALNSQLAEAAAQRQSLEERCASLEAHCHSLEEQAVQQQVSEPAPLDAYRRAETMERESRTRAELVYYQTNGVLTEASAKVDGVAKEVTDLADKAMESLTRLQMAVSGSKHTLQDAAAMMKSIRPNP